MEGRRGGGQEGWRAGGVEGRRGGGQEGWRAGGMACNRGIGHMTYHTPPKEMLQEQKTPKRTSLHHGYHDNAY